MNPFAWTEQTEMAASLVAQGNLNLEVIAKRVGVTRRTLWAWRQHDDFKARVDDEVREISDEVRRIGLSTVVGRVKALNERWLRMRQVIEERADSPEMRDVAGGTTGLLVKTVKGIGKGENFQLVAVYQVDTGLLKELREHEKQAAQELGQWVVKIEEAPPEPEADPVAAKAALAAGKAALVGRLKLAVES